METQMDLRFGALAVKNGFASESDIQFALETQRETTDEGLSPMLGEILKDMGALTPERVNALLVEQNVLRSGVTDTPVPGENPPAIAADPPAEKGGFKRLLAGIGDKLRRLFRDMSGKRAKEKAAASEKRDDLLAKIAEAGLEAGLDGPEAESAKKAREGLDTARNKAAIGAGTGAVAAKTTLKAAESKLRRALVKLGRSAIEKDRVPAGQEAAAAEVRALDKTIADLG